MILVLDRNTWNHIPVQKTLKQLLKKTPVQWTQYSNLLVWNNTRWVDMLLKLFHLFSTAAAVRKWIDL